MKLKGWCKTAQEILDCISKYTDVEIRAKDKRNRWRGDGPYDGYVWDFASGKPVRLIPNNVLNSFISRGFFKEYKRVFVGPPDRHWQIYFRMINEGDDAKILGSLNREKSHLADIYERLRDIPTSSPAGSMVSRDFICFSEQFQQLEQTILQVLSGGADSEEGA